MEKLILQNFIIQILIVIVSCLVKQAPGPLFEQFRIPFTKEWFVPSLTEIGLLVLEKIFFQYEHISLLWPLPTLGTMTWRNLNLHYIRKLSCKYDLFWLSGSGEKDS
jgi:hypothetical protein